MRSRSLRQVLCFVRTKHGASRLARQLEKDGLETSAIHGDKTQGARLEALDAFKEGKLEILVATDVAARGLDVDDLPLVVNYELPHVPEDYIHRIGRTGRAGATGEAISFVAPEEEKYLAEIERLLKKKIDVVTLDGFDPVAATVRSASPKPRVSRARPTEAREAPRREAAAPRPEEVREARTARTGCDAVGPGAQHARTRARGSVRPQSGPAVARPRRERRGPDRSALVHGHAGHGRKDKAKPIPALLMKRKAPETENA